MINKIVKQYSESFWQGKTAIAMAVCLGFLPVLGSVNIITPVVSKIFYLFIVLSAGAVTLVYLIWRKRINVSILTLCIALVAFSSLLVNGVWKLSAWLRLLLFFMLLASVGPLFYSRYFKLLRFVTLKTFSMSAVILSVIDVSVFFICKLFSLSVQVKDIFAYPVTLSLFGGVGVIYCAWMFCKKEKINVVTFVGMLFSAAAALIFASRIALAATVAALVVVVIYLYKKHTRAGRIRISLIAVLALVLFSGLIVPYSSEMQRKVDFVKQNEDVLASRRSLWENRIIEFEESPLLGVGFNTARYDSTSFSPFGTDGSDSVEPGSSWLYVLSSTGLVGFILILIAFLKGLFKDVRYLFRKKIHSKDKESYLLLTQILLFLGIAMLTEGFVYSVGNPFCVLFWLCVGLSDGIPFKKERNQDYSNGGYN